MYVFELQELLSEILGFPIIVFPKPGFPDLGIKTLKDFIRSLFLGMVLLSIQHSPPCMYTLVLFIPIGIFETG